MNKKKIINDPVYGFVSIPFDIIYDLIEHPYFQRLRRIRQVGLTHLVYPGAQHTRFQHTIGVMSLTHQAIETLRFKGIDISEAEAEATCIATLLHDIGHGPFSHTLERSIVSGISHEEISRLFMQKLNEEFDGALSLGIRVFENQYHKKFLHQLVSSQLDMDRLDYLKRDSFYSGVQEGAIGYDRIIKMLHVKDDQLVVEAKGIYSIEKFIIARRLMYWQVYLHKTVIAAESLLVHILRRAKALAADGVSLFASPALTHFLYQKIDRSSFEQDSQHLEQFSKLDDYDIMGAIKVWVDNDDLVLAKLSQSLINRRLPRIEIQQEAFDPSRIDGLINQVAQKLVISAEDASFFVFSESVKNNAYSLDHFNINILQKDGSVSDIAEASDLSNIRALTDTVTKYFLCYPKEFIN